jgi:hypothetical protein
MVQRRITRFRRASSKPVARRSVQRLSHTMHWRGAQRRIDARLRRDRRIDVLNERALRKIVKRISEKPRTAQPSKHQCDGNDEHDAGGNHQDLEDVIARSGMV